MFMISIYGQSAWVSMLSVLILRHQMLQRTTFQKLSNSVELTITLITLPFKSKIWTWHVMNNKQTLSFQNHQQEKLMVMVMDMDQLLQKKKVDMGTVILMVQVTNAAVTIERTERITKDFRLIDINTF